MTRTYYPEFHKMFKGLIVEVCEGKGTQDDACRLCYYVHDEQGNFIGKIDTLPKFEPPERNDDANN